jgi:diketogulonate reductase-like aldo/keto reductase
MFITTKLWNEDITARRCLEAFNECMNKLQTEYLDLYLVHWPVPGYEDAWRTMEKLYLEGKIRSIGVSNFQKKHIERLAEISAIIPAVNQVELHPYLTQVELVDYCQSKGIQIEAWSPLGGSISELREDAVIKNIAEKYNKTPVQVILRWDIQRGIITIPKSTKKEHIVSNLQVFDFILTEEEMDAINKLNRDFRGGPAWVAF